MTTARRIITAGPLPFVEPPAKPGGQAPDGNLPPPAFEWDSPGRPGCHDGLE